MTVDQSIARFVDTTFFRRPTTVQEANHGLFDPMYARFTWGKLVSATCANAPAVSGARCSRSGVSTPIGLLDGIEAARA